MNDRVTRLRWVIVPGCLFFLADAAPAQQPPDAGSAQASSVDAPWFAVVDDATAWTHLPPATAGQGERLPVWARVLAPSLPATTAGLLELDRVQRQDSTLDPLTRAEIRWIAARAHGCRYSLAEAEADYVRAGGRAEELTQPGNAERQRLREFVRRMCVAAYDVSDEEVEQLLQDRGPQDLTAIVLVVAYANFQDRLLSSLHVTQESDGPLLPSRAQFAWKKPPAAQPAGDKPPQAAGEAANKPERQIPAPPPDADAVPTHVADEGWKSVPLADLRQRLTGQQTRAARIPIPPPEVLRQQMPKEHYQPGRSERILWNSVAYGYQPQLTAAWFSAMRQFREESGLPDELRQSAFWVVTRSNLCFY